MASASATFLLLVLSATWAWAEDFFDTNRVMQIQLEMAPSDWDLLRYQSRESEFFPETTQTNARPREYDWFSATVTIDGERYTRARVRKKGYIGSNDTKRPALKIRLRTSSGRDSDSPATELTLNNNRQDPSLIRQYLAYEVFRRAEVPSPRCSFARVAVNGASLGLFTHVESIKRPFLRRSFGQDDGQLYEGGRSDFRSGWFQNFQVKSQGKGRPHGDLEAATTALEDPERPFLPTLSRYVDLEEFLRFWAVESLINDADGYAANANNFYLYHDPVSDRFNFIPWGKDTVMHSRRWSEGREPGPKSVIAVGILAYRLYISPEGCARYRAALRRVLQEAWNEEALLKEVARLELLLGSSATAEFGAALDELRHFITSRRADIQPELAGNPPQLKSKPLELAKRRNVGHFEASFSAPWGKLDRAAPLGSGPGSLSGTLYGKKLNFSRVGTQAGALSESDPEGRAGITIAGIEAAGGRVYVIYLAVDPDLYAPGATLPVNNTHVFGGLLEINPKGHVPQMLGMLRGSLRLRAADRKADGRAEGEVSIDVFSKLPEP